MIKFTDSVASGNFTDTFCKNTNKLKNSWGVGGGGGGRGVGEVQFLQFIY